MSSTKNSKRKTNAAKPKYGAEQEALMAMYGKDMQAPIEKSPETAMQVKEPYELTDVEAVVETAPKPDPEQFPRKKRDIFDVMLEKQRRDMR